MRTYEQGKWKWESKPYDPKCGVEVEIVPIPKKCSVWEWKAFCKCFGLEYHGDKACMPDYSGSVSWKWSNWLIRVDGRTVDGV